MLFVLLLPPLLGWAILQGERHGLYDAATALAARADDVRDAVLVVAAERWPGAGTHWRSTSRKLALRASRPVLVVPADRDASIR